MKMTPRHDRDTTGLRTKHALLYYSHLLPHAPPPTLFSLFPSAPRTCEMGKEKKPSCRLIITARHTLNVMVILYTSLVHIHFPSRLNNFCVGGGCNISMAWSRPVVLWQQQLCSVLCVCVLCVTCVCVCVCVWESVCDVNSKAQCRGGSASGCI